jgi:hypothetical protein
VEPRLLVARLPALATTSSFWSCRFYNAVGLVGPLRTGLARVAAVRGLA